MHAQPATLLAAAIHHTATALSHCYEYLWRTPNHSEALPLTTTLSTLGQTLSSLSTPPAELYRPLIQCSADMKALSARLAAGREQGRALTFPLEGEELKTCVVGVEGHVQLFSVAVRVAEGQVELARAVERYLTVETPVKKVTVEVPVEIPSEQVPTEKGSIPIASSREGEGEYVDGERYSSQLWYIRGF